ncbi:metal-dependent hydrolase [bacterium]|mgnify:CR=1 FL=1|nr:MAG: metal-dependent hydrolase [bacterium]RKZ26046.1 MAG: metal-dependent hydrolase [bacterium]
MKVYFLGHAAVKLEGAKTVYIDPFLTGNPVASEKKEDAKADYVIVTHDHGDHLGDAFDIAKANGAVLFAQHEIAVKAQENGIEAEGMNVGGAVEREGIKVWFTNAIHTSETGHPMGAVVEMEGKRVYHAGDTGLFGDMKLIGELFKPDVALLPIGGRYTMDEEQAAYAVKLIKPGIVIPIHYNTFPIIKADPERFKELVGGEAEVRILNPGEFVEI